MLTVIELLIGVVVIVGVARYIIKGYSATGVLFVGGLVLLIISALMGLRYYLPAKPVPAIPQQILLNTSKFCL